MTVPPADDPEVHLHVRMRKSLRDEIDAAGLVEAMNRSEWVLKTLLDALRRRPRGRQVFVQRERVVSRQSQQLCNHPLPHRSEKHPDGSSRCLACDAVIRPLR